MRKFSFPRFALPRFFKDRRGVAAAEFALIAPALTFIVMGVLEMSMRFRASEEATRYVHQVADLLSRQNNLTQQDLEDIYDASIYLMRPLDSTEDLDLDIASVQFLTPQLTPTTVWRRQAGDPVEFLPAEAAGLGAQDETVLHVGVRYHYNSVLTTLFGGGQLDIVRVAFARPREERIIRIDGQPADNNGNARPFGN